MIRVFLLVVMLAVPAFAANTNKVTHIHEFVEGCIVASATPDAKCPLTHAYPRRTCKTCWREEELINGKWKQITHEEVVAKVEKEKEKKLEHRENKIVKKERDKGSKKVSDWKTVKEYTLMFKNNRKARPNK